MIDFLYLCDGKNCQDKPQWKAYGCGECKHTTNPEHAKNKHVADIAEGIKERFGTSDGRSISVFEQEEENEKPKTKIRANS